MGVDCGNILEAGRILAAGSTLEAGSVLVPYTGSILVRVTLLREGSRQQGDRRHAVRCYGKARREALVVAVYR